MVLVTAANGNAGRNFICELIKKNIPVKATDISPNTELLKELGVKEIIIGHIGRKHVVKKTLEGCD